MAYSYITNSILGYNDLPFWIEEYAELLRQYRISPEKYQAPSVKGNTIGIVKSFPAPSGAYNEYNFILQSVETTVDGLNAGQQVWIAASISDFPDLLTIETILSGDMDNSRGWWVFKGLPFQ